MNTSCLHPSVPGRLFFYQAPAWASKTSSNLRAPESRVIDPTMQLASSWPNSPQQDVAEHENFWFKGRGASRGVVKHLSF